MEYRRLGRSGLQVSAVGIGTNRMGDRVDQETTKQIVHRAMELGVNFIDTANVYTKGKSEELLGNALQGIRHEFVLATKVGWAIGSGPNQGGASRQQIMKHVEISLRKLQTDYIDLYQIHRWDPNTPLDESLRAMDDLVRSGKVRYIGASNFDAWQLCRANDLTEMLHLNPLVSIQPHYNMLHREPEQELIPCARAFNISILPYFPLAGGFLTGKYKPGVVPADSRGEWMDSVQALFTEKHFTMMERLTAFAQERGRTTVQLAVAWLLAQPQVASVINGVRNIAQLEDNARAHDWHLTAAELQEIDGLLKMVQA
ncbi:MAG: aldo/keto reductase [Chloroflexi bacterium]|nr:aldo/keto reductase [Chloroflexota bacterium]